MSWAARLRRKPVIGIGHQYAFNHDIPLLGDDLVSRGLLHHFAPVDIGLGLHWHHFNQPILPPICDVPEWSVLDRRSDKVVVYLPFVNYPPVHQRLAQWLAENRPQSVESLSEELWDSVKVTRGNLERELKFAIG